MPTRPNVLVSLRPAIITPGSAFEAIVRLESRKETAVSKVEVRFWGEQQSWSGDSGQPASRIVDLIATDQPKRLPAGAYETRVRFVVPSGAPPSYRGTTLRVEYTVRVHVDIPWWPDRVTEFEIPVQQAPTVVNEQGHTVKGLDRGPGGLAVECAVDRVVLSPGDVITGKVAFNRTRESGLGRVKLRLRCIESTAFGVNDGPNFVLELPIARHRDGEAHTFRLKIPDHVVPAFRCGSGFTMWQLDLDASVAGRGEETLLSLPLHLVAKGTQGMGLPRELPLIGDRRRSEMFARIARSTGMQFDADAGALIGTIEGAQVTVGRGEDGSTEALLRWAPLDIELTLGPARWNDALSSHEITVGSAAFDDRYQLRGREREQVLALFTDDVVRALTDAHDVTMNDRGATVRVPDVGGDEQDLARFVRGALALAASLQRNGARLPAAKAVRDRVDDWRALASRHYGRFSPVNGALRGLELRTEKVDFEHVFDRERALASRLSAPFEPPLAAPPEADKPDSIRAEWAQPLREISDNGGRWSARPTGLLVTLTPAVLDPAEAERWILRVAAASKAIQGRRDNGPFR